jgi:hypothetical protein
MGPDGEEERASFLPPRAGPGPTEEARAVVRAILERRPEAVVPLTRAEVLRVERELEGLVRAVAHTLAGRH